MANWMIFQVVRNKFSSVHSRRNVCCSLAVFCILQIYLHSMKQPLGPKDMSRFCPFSDSLFRHSFRMSNSYCMFPLTVYCVSHKRWWWLLKLHVRLLRELRENKISRKLVVVVAVLGLPLFYVHIGERKWNKTILKRERIGGLDGDDIICEMYVDTHTNWIPIHTSFIMEFALLPSSTCLPHRNHSKNGLRSDKIKSKFIYNKSAVCM